jgi:FtsH-binding integral membrane protein
MESEQDKENRTPPIEVSNAIKLFYLVLFLGIFSTISGISNLDKIIAQYPTFSPTFYYLIILFSYAFLFFFIYKIRKGRNWARITFFILFVLGLPFSIFTLPNSFTISLINGVLTIIGIILQIIALVFLFQKPSSDWFKSMKIKNTREQQEEEIYQTELIKEKARLQARKEFNQEKKK